MDSPQKPTPNICAQFLAFLFSTGCIIAIFFGLSKIHLPPAKGGYYQSGIRAGKDMEMGSTVSTDYVPLVPYNGTIPTGGDSLTNNLNVFYEVSRSSWTCIDAGLN